MRKYKYKSDWMSRKMDEELELLEERLTALYKTVTKNVQAEFMAFSNSFEDAYIEMVANLSAGDITQAEFRQWIEANILKSEVYKATVESMTGMLVNADVAAMAIINGELPYVVAQSYNFVQSLGFAAADDAGISVGTFQIYNANSIEKLIKENPELLPKPSQKTIESLGGTVSIPEDKKWNQTKINQQISQSLVRGDSIPQVAQNLQNVTNMDENAAIRNARTAMTCAENMGRTLSAEKLKENGIPINEEWSAVRDNRTRETHLLLDGTLRDKNGYFGATILEQPLRFPGDPLGDPSEVYNCRCRLNVILPGIDHSQDGSLYEQFLQENDIKSYEKLKEQGRL